MFGDKDKPIMSGPMIRMDDGNGVSLLGYRTCDGTAGIAVMVTRNGHQEIVRIADCRKELLAVRKFINRTLREIR